MEIYWVNNHISLGIDGSLDHGVDINLWFKKWCIVRREQDIHLLLSWQRTLGWDAMLLLSHILTHSSSNNNQQERPQTQDMIHGQDKQQRQSHFIPSFYSIVPSLFSCWRHIFSTYSCLPTLNPGSLQTTFIHGRHILTHLGLIQHILWSCDNL